MQETQPNELIGTWLYSSEESTVKGSVLAAGIEIRSDNSVKVIDFPRAQLTPEDFTRDPITTTGTWKLIDRLPEGAARFENQSGVQILIPTFDSAPGTKTAVNLAIEKRGTEVPRLAFYIGFPDTLDKVYVLTKTS